MQKQIGDEIKREKGQRNEGGGEEEEEEEAAEKGDKSQDRVPIHQLGRKTVLRRHVTLGGEWVVGERRVGGGAAPSVACTALGGVLPKLRKRHCDGWVGGWVGPLFSLFCFSRLPRRNCVAAGSRFRCRSVLRLWVGDRTGGRVVKKRRRDSERWELDTVRTGYDTNCAL